MAASAVAQPRDVRRTYRPTPASPLARRRVVIGASGDLIAHLKVNRVARDHEAGFVHVLGGLRPVIDPEEIAFLNLETPLSERVPPHTGEPPLLGAPAEVAEALRQVGVDVVSVANNHSLDQGADGMDETLRALSAAGVGTVGAARRSDRLWLPWVVERGAVRVAFLALTERINRGPGLVRDAAWVARMPEDLALPAIRRARAFADVVVVSVHWNHDFVEAPRRRHRRLARRWVDAGADLVLGHGPHVLQRVERLPSPRGEAVVAYSLGNLVSNQGLRYFLGRTRAFGAHPAVVLPTVRDGAWLRVAFEVGVHGRLTLEPIKAVPLWTHNNFWDAAYRAQKLTIEVRPLSAMHPELYRERFPAIRDALGDAVQVEGGRAW